MRRTVTRTNPGGQEERRRLLRHAPALAIATLLSGWRRPAAAAGPAPRELAPQEPRPVPDFSFTDAAGTAHALAGFEGKAFVINFWATWCAPCVAEMPALDRLQRAVSRDGIIVLALSSDRGGAAQVQPFYERVGIRDLGVWLDPRGAAARAFGVRAVPTTVIIDRRLRDVARLAGPAEWDAEAMVSVVRRLAGPVPVPQAPA